MKAWPENEETKVFVFNMVNCPGDYDRINIVGGKKGKGRRKMHIRHKG
jgi:hypothetical protein